MTPAQKSTIASILSVDLATLDSDRLIELCVIYRAAPDALDTFPTALKAELERRYSSEVIASEDVNFGVLQHMSNQFQSAIPYFHLKLLEMTGTINRDIWFTDNEALFRASIDNAEVAAWIVKQPDILNKCLGNRLALGYIAQSTTAATAILSDETACAVWKNAPDLWQVWPLYRPGFDVVAKSAELTQYIIDTPAALAAVVASDNAMQPLIASATARRVWVDSEVAMTAVAASQTAMTAVAASQTAMTAVVASQTAMTAVAASQTAMTAVVASQTAMTAVAASQTAMTAVAASQTAMTAVAASQTAMTAVALSSVALAEIVQTATARTALITHNDNLQAVRQQVYNTVKTSWHRKVNVHSGGSGGPGEEQALTNPIKSPENALVFACLGNLTGHPNGIHQLKHPDGSIAARNPPGRTQATSMVAVDGISFGGASIYIARNYGYSYVELWTKE